jgi:hypothetical protein
LVPRVVREAHAAVLAQRMSTEREEDETVAHRGVSWTGI